MGWHARCRTVAPAVVRRAEMGPAFHDFARDLDVRHVGIVALISFSTSRVEARAAGLRNLFVLLIPIRRPFPYVAGHLVEPVAVGRKTLHRCRSLEPILFKILPGKFTLPGIRHLFAVRSECIAPNELGTIQSP